MLTLNKGTIQYLPVQVSDALGILTTLAAASPVFDTRKVDIAETAIETGIAAVPNGMTAMCLINTTNVLYTEGDYDLFLRFNAAPEIPKLGPFRFRIED